MAKSFTHRAGVGVWLGEEHLLAVFRRRHARLQVFHIGVHLLMQGSCVHLELGGRLLDEVFSHEAVNDKKGKRQRGWERQHYKNNSNAKRGMGKGVPWTPTSALAQPFCVLLV